MATLAVTLYAFCLFVEKPTAVRACALGAACAVAVLSKFSSAPFFLAAAFAILVGFDG